MNKWMIAALVAFVLAGCGGESGTFDDSGFIRALESEPQIYQADMTSTGNIYVAVDDNGNDRKGYAMYVCEVAREFAEGDINTKLVKIVDQSSASSGDSLKELGRYRCKFN